MSLRTKEPLTEYYDQHYKSKYQPIEVMQDAFTDAEFTGFLKGNIIKYALRMGKKDDPAKEAHKILRYAEWLVQHLDGEIIDPRKG